LRKVWRPVPLHLAVYELLKLKGGTVTDEELYDSVKAVYDVCYDEFIKVLMKLELNGYIKVATAREGTLIVELVRDESKWE